LGDPGVQIDEVTDQSSVPRVDVIAISRVHVTNLRASRSRDPDVRCGFLISDAHRPDLLDAPGGRRSVFLKTAMVLFYVRDLGGELGAENFRQRPSVRAFDKRPRHVVADLERRSAALHLPGGHPDQHEA
jgi:hypothetical protein